MLSYQKSMCTFQCLVVNEQNVINHQLSSVVLCFMGVLSLQMLRLTGEIPLGRRPSQPGSPSESNNWQTLESSFPLLSHLS